MATVFSAKNSHSLTGLSGRRRKNIASRSFSLRLGSKLSDRRLEGNVSISAVSFLIPMISLVIVGGIFYLYQVNDLATKGYEVKEVENRIKELEEEGKKLRIRETELRSMYTIEKDTEDLNLVNSENISYIEVNGPIALK